MYLEPGRPDLGYLRHLFFAGLSDWGNDTFKYYLTELDEDGRPVRWLFDSVVPEYTLPSGNYPGADVNIGTTMSGEGDFYAVPSPTPAHLKDWESLLDLYFARGGELDLLDEQVGELAAAIGEPPHPRNVVIVLPYPSHQLCKFGELDGRRLNFSVLGQNLARASEDRLTALLWYIRGVARRWEEKKYKRLNLLGFYWPFETVYRSWDIDDHWVLKHLRPKVNALGLKMTWIPFWASWNVHLLDDYESYYFDAAFLQSNHLFYKNIPGVEEAARAAEARHAGVEMEFYVGYESNFDPVVVREKMERFRRYLDGGVDFGYMKNSACAWFLGGGVMPKLHQSSDPADRETYRDIVSFIHGEYEKKGP